MGQNGRKGCRRGEKWDFPHLSPEDCQKTETETEITTQTEAEREYHIKIHLRGLFTALRRRYCALHTRTHTHLQYEARLFTMYGRSMAEVLQKGTWHPQGHVRERCLQVFEASSMHCTRAHTYIFVLAHTHTHTHIYIHSSYEARNSITQGKKRPNTHRDTHRDTSGRYSSSLAC